MGPGFGKGMGEAIIALFWVGIVIGAVVVTPIVLLVIWLAKHISISWV